MITPEIEEELSKEYTPVVGSWTWTSTFQTELINQQNNPKFHTNFLRTLHICQTQFHCEKFSSKNKIISSN